MYALADQWAERDPGEGKDVCELLCRGKWTRLVLLTFSVQA